MADERIQSFDEFYPFYLGEHAVPLCRILHFIGTTLVVATTITAAVSLNPWLLLAVPVLGYGFAWVGHFVVEKNRPATFTYPLWSLMGDFVMWSEMLRGRLWTGHPLERHGA
jgi:hypothetical protein